MSESGELVDDKRAAAEITPENRELPEWRKHWPPKGGMDNLISVSEKWMLTDLIAVYCTTLDEHGWCIQMLYRNMSKVRIFWICQDYSDAPMADSVLMLGRAERMQRLID